MSLSFLTRRSFIVFLITVAFLLPGLTINLSTQTGEAHVFMQPLKTETASPANYTIDETRNKENIQQAYASLPLVFEENRGQTSEQVKFISRGSGYMLFLTPTEAVFNLRNNDTSGERRSPAQRANLNHRAKSGKASYSAIRMKLRGASKQPHISGEREIAAKTNYFIGNDSTRWSAVANYERVRYQSVYPGIDLIYYGRQKQLEYDFELHPGAEPRQIQLEINGVRRLTLEKSGALLMKLKGGAELRQHKPIVYQEINGERREVAGRYVLKGKNRIGFEVGEYDARQVLIIDPVLTYSTYLGGSSSDIGSAIAADRAGNAYVTGTTQSTDFPVFNQYQNDQSQADVFVTKFNTKASGAASLLYSTYLGGSGDFYDSGEGIAVDQSGIVYVGGHTSSLNFPTRNQFQTNADTDNNVDTDAFVAKLNTNVSGAASLLYSTYLGGNSHDYGYDLAIDQSGGAYLTGRTHSSNYPTRNQFQTNAQIDNNSGSDVFVTKLDTNASGNASLVYSTYLGGSSFGNYEMGFGIAVDQSGLAYVTGATDATNFPTINAYQSNLAGSSDVFVVKLNPNLSGNASLLYSTYLGGGGGETAQGIAVDHLGNAYVAGDTTSTDFPVLHHYQANQPFQDVFVTKLNTNVSGPASLLYSTYLGGGYDDYGWDITADRAGNAYVVGKTESLDYPTFYPYQTAADINTATVRDVTITKLNTHAAGAASMLYSTYLGGATLDIAQSIALDEMGSLYVTGYTDSNNFPTRNQYQTEQTATDAFVTKISFRHPYADFDGDGLTDLSLWSPDDHNWYVNNSRDGSSSIQYDWGSGALGDVPVPRDYDGDLKADIAVWRPSEGNWYIVRSSDGSVMLKNWGRAGDTPVPADYDGDGRADIAVFRSSENNWYITNSSNNSVVIRQWGLSNDKLVPADYDGDGRADIAVWRPSDGNWYLILSATETVITPNWGQSGDIPVPADYNGDDKTDITVWRPSTGNWYSKNSTTNISTVRNWGSASSGDVPVPGDYDGDGRADIAVWRPSEGNWYILRSTNNSVIVANLGASGDVPAPATYIPQ
jgi:hypothetical protein